MIKAAANEQLPVVHPDQPGFAGITIAQLSGPPHAATSSRRNVVTVSTGKLDWDRPSTWTGAIDRSPCGTGTCAKMAALHARGRLGLDEPFVHEGILGTPFTGRLVEETTVGPYRAVVPELTGTAWITGFSSWVGGPEDPLPEGVPGGGIWEAPGRAARRGKTGKTRPDRVLCSFGAGARSTDGRFRPLGATVEHRRDPEGRSSAQAVVKDRLEPRLPRFPNLDRAPSGPGW